MSDVIVSTNDPITTVTTTDNLVEIAITNNPVEVSASTAGVQGASYNQGDPIYVTVRNATGATLPKGTIVYLSGANGNHVQVTPAIATSDATSARTLGWLAQSLANNASGLCQIEGYLEGLNTHGLTAGNQLYLSGTTAGAFTATKPQAPIHLVYVGVVTKVSTGDGHVFVKVQNGYELDELHDVQIISPVNNQVLTYDSATDLWKNATNPADGVTSITATAPLTGGTITSTGSIGLDQTALSITQSQVSGLVSDLAGKANLAGGNALTGAQTITSTASGSRVLTLTGASGQTGRLLELQNNSGDALTWIGSAGQVRTSVSIRSISMDSVIGQLAMQSGNALTPTAILRGATAQTADLFQVQDSAGNNFLNVNSVGSLLFGSGSGSFLSGANGRVNIQLSGDNVGLTVRAFGGQTADLVKVQNNVGSDLLVVSPTGTFRTAGLITAGNVTDVLGQLSVYTTAASRIGAVIRGAGSQTADALQIQNSGGLVQTYFDAFGNGHIAQAPSGSSFGLYVGTNANPAVGGIMVRGAASQTGDLQQWQNSAGSIIAKVDSVGDITARVQRSTFAARFTTTDPSIAIQVNTAASGQTGDFIQMQNSGGTVLSRIQNDGSLTATSLTVTSLGTYTTGSIYSDSNWGMIFRARTASPTNAQYRWANSIDGELMRLDNSGRLIVSNATSGATQATAQIEAKTANATTLGLTITGSSAQTADLLLLRNNGLTTQFRVDPNGMTIANSLGVAGSPSGISYAYFTTPVASAVPVVIRGAASQTADLLQLQTSAGVSRVRITPSGEILATNDAIRGPQLFTFNYLNQLQERNSGGELTMQRQTAATTNPGANLARLYFRDGTNAGTLKLVVRAGAAGAETTILDNIPQ